MENNHNERTRKQKYCAIGMAILLVTTFVAMHPVQTSYAASAEAIPQFDSCVLRTGINAPEDPISMNTIVVDVKNHGIAKTIHAEKEIYDCDLVQGNLPVIVDVTTIAEKYENMTTQKTIRNQAEVITCIKTKEGATLIGCSTYRPSTSPVPVGTNCSEELITHPQEMNTVNKGSIVKTIEAQKEVFLCTLSGTVQKKVEIIVFAEVWENLNKLPNDPVIKKTFESMRCVVLVTDGTSINLNNNGKQDGTVESCQFSDVAT
jgi:hypothetical protein